VTLVAGRLSRFLNLERRRPSEDLDPRLPSTQQRFRPSPDDVSAGDPGTGDVSPGDPAHHDPVSHSRAQTGSGERHADRPAAAAPLATSGRSDPGPLVDEALERLRLERLGQFASGVELADTSDAEQPFRKCALCEMDNNRAAPRCQNCGADLATDEQRDFNARLWAQRREELAREQAELALLHGPHGPHAPHGADAGHEDRDGARALGEALARRAGIEETMRLSLDGGPAGGFWSAPLGWRLLGLIGPDWLRYAAGLGIVGFAVLLGSLSLDEMRSGVRFSVPEAFLIALGILFLPRTRWRRGFFGFWP
jgi:hypothetical protein